MTDFNFCCLCASDEGVFLDIFTSTDRQLGKRSFLKEFETCLSVKVKQDEALSTRICHRCAIELGQCNKFVAKYNEAHEKTVKLKKTLLKKSCCLCLSSSNNICLFTLAKDFRSTVDPLQKIYECFNRQITRVEAEGQSICLLCRYNLDVLYDLRKLAGEVTSKLKKIAESRAVLANLSKTQTFVVNRKTTKISKSRIEFETYSESDSESDTMARKHSKSKKLGKMKSSVELKLRSCGQCHNSIEDGVDMYRLHRTGLTVCKMCWVTMDPFKPHAGNKRKRANQTEIRNTRLCAVFLKDVLSPANSKDNSSLKIETDDKGEPIYVISDDTSDNGDEVDVRSTKRYNTRRNDTTDGESDTNSRQKLKRGLKQEETENRDSGPNKKLRRSTRYQSSDSDSGKGKRKDSSSSDDKSNFGYDAKFHIVNSMKKVGKVKPDKRRAKPKGTNSESMKSKSEDSGSSGESGVGRRNLRKVRNKVPLILKPELKKSHRNQKNMRRGETRTTTRRESLAVSKNSDSSIRSLGKNQPSKIKPSPEKSKTLMAVSFPIKVKNRYTCKVCGTEYKNKVIGMKHELTHFKQFEIKIEKLNTNRHFQNNDELNTSTHRLPDTDATCSIDLESTNKNPVQSEPPTSTTPPEIDEDRGKASDHETEELETTQRSDKAESIQKDKSPDIEDAEEKDAAIPSNGHPAEEEESTIETVENPVPESAAETNDGQIKDNSSNVEDDSITRRKSIEKDDTMRISIETNIFNDNVGEETGEDSDETIIINNEKDNGAKGDINEADTSPSSKNANSEVCEKGKDSGEEIESDVDIRIVDSGSSVEDSEQKAKCTDEKSNTENILATEETEDSQINEKEKSRASSERENTSNEVLEADVTSTLVADNDLDTRNGANGTTSQNDEENVNENESETNVSEAEENTEKEVQPERIVNEILQEVMDLATEEVKKRTDEVSSIPETLENISEEIKKTGEGSPAGNDILESTDTVTNKDIETREF